MLCFPSSQSTTDTCFPHLNTKLCRAFERNELFKECIFPELVLADCLTSYVAYEAICSIEMALRILNLIYRHMWDQF